MKKNTSAKMIKKAIDSYPGGICFSALDGRVILVNEKMNKLMLELTGYTMKMKAPTNSCSSASPTTRSGVLS